MNTPIDPTTIDPFTLKSGSHGSRTSGMCALEAVAYLAGEPHSDRPECACPILAAYFRRLNDARWSSDEARTEAMWPAVVALLNSRNDDKEVRSKRAYALADYAVRTSAAGAMEAVGLNEQAAALRALSPVVDKATAEAARTACYAARNAADAAYAAAAYASAAADAADAAVASAADAKRDQVLGAAVTFGLSLLRGAE